MRRLSIGLSLTMVLLTGTLARAELASGEAQNWLRRVIPLPKEIAVHQLATVSPAGLRVRTIGTPGEQVQAALAPLVTPSTKGGGDRAAFELIVGRCSEQGELDGAAVPGAERLRALPNREQAYAMAPRGARALVLCALTDQGLAYAVNTFTQLVKVNAVTERLTIPLVTVVDWPDLAERGEWGGSCVRDIEWMSAVRMNLIEAHADLKIGADGHGVAQMNPQVIERGRRAGVKVVPIITHLDQLGGSGLFERYPETIGQGDAARPKSLDVVAPCFSRPKTAEMLADWMVSLAAQPGVGTICVWLSEIGAKCGCADCQKAGQFTLETRACVRAWRLARERNPKVVLRILLTQGSYTDNDKVLAEVPPGVEVSYYDGGRTYDSSRDPMIYPLLADWTKSGRWLGVYPQITASWRIVCPWSGPQFIRTRMNEFQDKQLKCLCAYATPDNRLYEFNVLAAAEWSWNAKGRDEREFARAWATRKGLADIEAAADWAVTLGEVGWDVYGSGVPFPGYFGAAARLIKARQQPVLGKGLFRYFTEPARFERDRAAVAKATALAEQLRSPLLLTETRVIGGYLTMVEKLYAMATLFSRATPPADAEREQLNRDLLAFSEAGYAVSTGLQEWERVCLGQGGSRLADTVQITEQTVADVSQALRPLGVRNPGLAYFRQKVGAWQDDDFEAKQSVRKTWEVTPQVAGEGRYEVTFVYTKGWHGLTMSRVALCTAPADDRTKLTEVVVDQHPGVAAYQNRANVYTLNLERYDPALRYFVVADIGGVKSSDKPLNRRGCQGEVLMAKVRAPGQVIAPLPLLPMDPAERARYGGPKFSTANPHVVVVQGGYGSESLLAALTGQAGLEVLPLWTVTPAALKGVQVVVLPQPRAKESLKPEAVKALAQFVRDGGGVITLHDAVGYRGVPPLLPEICAGGTDKVREPAPTVAAEHAVTAGLPTGRALTIRYYDAIAVKPGPQGTVLLAAKSGQPLLVCGAAGRGRLVACGLAPGLDAEEDREVAPTADELRLLTNAVRWVAGR